MTIKKLILAVVLGLSIGVVVGLSTRNNFPFEEPEPCYTDIECCQQYDTCDQPIY